MAFGNTVKIQSDDDAPELYKETLPRLRSCFLQLRARRAALRAGASSERPARASNW